LIFLLSVGWARIEVAHSLECRKLSNGAKTALAAFFLFCQLAYPEMEFVSIQHSVCKKLKVLGYYSGFNSRFLFKTTVSEFVTSSVV
jgi:hypothetical protein